MKSDPLISVIVPVYNVEEYLQRCVDSILSQTYRNLEIILVDDGTKDSSDRICDEYAVRDPRVKVLHKENGGLSSARNAGLDIARGEYVAFVDSDDWIEPRMYECMLDLAQRYDVKFVCAGRYDVDSKTGEKMVGLCPKLEEVISGEEMAKRIFLWDHCDSAAWDKLYHRSLFQTVRYPLGKICEDVPTTYRIALEAGKAVLCSKPFYNYFHRPGSITTSSVSEKSYHFCEHTEQIYAHIRQDHPAIADAARYQRVRALSNILLRLDTANESVRRDHKNKYREIRRQLGEHWWFILRSGYFGKKEKITYLLLVLGLYRVLRPVFTKQKSE